MHTLLGNVTYDGASLPIHKILSFTDILYTAGVVYVLASSMKLCKHFAFWMHIRAVIICKKHADRINHPTVAAAPLFLSPSLPVFQASALVWQLAIAVHIWFDKPNIGLISALSVFMFHSIAERLHYYICLEIRNAYWDVTEATAGFTDISSFESIFAKQDKISADFLRRAEARRHAS